ncbi:hybrid sensor histidine kinase/response regulator [Geobacter argillaceus]|uniref:histidine kinase n=1 Tax=Geobacter argillaceus TaxID=345631 RepID=A0A562VNE5_9BACT|nr:ATP-binding protein [Geobacter argillaceus]TWJ19506.1 GAF sensor hybrid histidine kinase [Geobacter argillaceus]
MSGKRLRLLHIEDSPEDAALILNEISAGGYQLQCERVANTAAMQKALVDNVWDLVIADFILPGFSAFDALIILRESGLNLPFIIVSRPIGEDQLVAAMKAGAHDYLLKENLSRLVPAIERELREAAERSRHRRAEQAISQGKKEWEAAFDSVSDLIVLTDPDGVVIRCNKRLIEYFLTSYSDMLGRNIVDIFYGSTEPDNPVFQPGNFSQGIDDLAFPMLEGWFTVSSYPFHWDDNQLAGGVYVIKDVTKRKQIEQEKQIIDRELLTLYAIAYRLNSARSSKMVMVDLLFQLHNMLQIDFSSIHLLDNGVLKLRASLGLPRSAQEAIKRLPDYAPWVNQVLAGKPFRSHTLVGRLPMKMVKGAREMGIRAWCAVPLTIGQDVLGVLMVGHKAERHYSDRELFLLSSIASQLAVLIENHALYDQMKEKAEELQRSRQALKENLQEVKRANIELGRLNAAKNNFIGMASHELKTPITSVLGGVQFLLHYSDISLTPEQHDIFTSVYEGVLQLKDIVDNLLSISRIEAKGLVLQKRPLNLALLCREVYDTFALPLSRRRIVVDIEADEEPVPADDSFTKLVVRNLLENAIKFTPDGGSILLSGRVTTRQELLAGTALIQQFYPHFPRNLVKGEHFYRLEVVDSGIGIAPAERQRIFDKFYSAGSLDHHSSGKTDFMSKGTGLGLSIVKGILDAHHGLVWVEDGMHGTGSVFTLVFPLNDSP